jgi:hypothetical protein
MKLIQVTKRIGELLGPIDWSFDFMSISWDRNQGGGTNPEVVKQAVEDLKEMKVGDFVEVYGIRHKVLEIGMYDGWPYWSPFPSVCIETHYGPEWHGFSHVRLIREGTKHA